MNKIDFSDLTKKREEWVRVNKENSFDEGIKKLLTDLYPDNAHFIYELLQNAEDANATEVNFELFNNKLKFSHNGKFFDYNDIVGITSIGQGTKANDINKIGKFGVGFKAVFAYTSTPKIYSKDCDFKISDLVVPTVIESIIPDSLETLMVFPFNNPNKPKEKAYKEIYKGLNSIEDNTLLFLTNIQKISYTLDDKIYIIERDEIDDIIIEITNSKNKTTTKWLRFKKYLPKKNRLYVSVAFEIAIDKSTKEEYVKPINGQVSIFFPAEKEKSNLKFHIHAPFSSTVARDSIKDLLENNELRDLISKLLLDVLKYLKRNQLLDYDFLACMPNDEDNLSEFYLPIKESLIDYFNYNNFLITETGVHRSASECFLFDNNSSKELMKPILKKIIHYYYNREYKNTYYLAPNKIKIKKRVKSFIDILNILELNDTRIVNIFSYLTNSDEILQDIIGSESDKWFRDLYIFLNHNLYFLDKTQFKKFILLNNGNLNLNKEDCYFSKIDMKHFPIVKESVYFRNTEAKNFLEQKLGVKKVGEKESVEIILKENYQGYFVEIEKHIEHIEKFLIYYQQHKTDFEFFKKYSFLKVAEHNGYEKLEKIYIDSPFEKTGMSAIGKNNKSLFSLNEIYHKLDKENKKVFIEFLKKLGAITQLSIEEKSQEKPIHINPYHLNTNYNLRKKWIEDSKNVKSRYREFKDYYLSKNIFKNQTLELSLLIWNTVKKLENAKRYATYRYRKDKIEREDSLLLYQLKNEKWIPDKNGKFYKPQDIFRDMLPDEFKYEQDNIWLQAVEFGKNIKENEENYKLQEKIVEDATGFSLNQLEKARDAKLTDSDIAKLIKDKDIQQLQESLEKNQGNGETPEFIPPKNREEIIIDDKAYEDKVHEENKKNDNKYISSQTTYKRQDHNEIKRIKDFLYNEYEGHCQICGDTFADGNKNTYTTKSLNIGKLRDVNRKGNTLCLCFKHYEICKRKLRNILFYEKIKDKNKLTIEDMDKIFELYDWVDKEDKELIFKSFYMLHKDDEFIRDDVYFLPIRMFKKDEYIKFTKAHLMEFIEVWNEN